ncbi:hypothetical protein BU15DRAFT_87530 [Melanogaster broomeanus]|nr:hypothetical protein BU15DRAFT_87530 [Melanogaster broomeanus]
MGRPLFSKTFQSAPAVRLPDPPCPYEKWSHLNAFDPDSDEFFDDALAVYEDFIDPGHGEQMVGEEERDMLVVRMGNASPISSEGSLSDSDTPMAVGDEDPAHLVVDDFHDLTHMDDSESTLTDPAPSPSDAMEYRRMSHQRSSSVSVNRGFISYHDYAERLPAPTPSAPIPVPVMRSRRSTSLDEHVLPSPSTPHFRETPVAHLSMSPPPSTTPRLYSWGRNPTYSTSPSAGSPFINAHARTSYTHLSPALIRIRDVTV